MPNLTSYTPPVPDYYRRWAESVKFVTETVQRVKMSGIVSVEGLFMEDPSFFFWGRRSGSLTPSLLVDSIMLVEDRSSS